MTQPPDPRPPLLMTRPQAASRAFAAGFRARFGADWPVILAPVMEIAVLDAPIPEFDAVIFTSQNAVAPLAGQVAARGRRAYCVGSKTAAAAREAGFDVVSGSGDAAALVEVIRAHHNRGRLLHARGEEIAFPLADTLKSAGIDTDQAILYRQEACTFPDDLRERIMGGGPLLVPLFSPRSARLLADRLGGDHARLRIAAISPAVAEAAKALRPEALEVADRPDADGVEQALARLIGAANAG